MHKFNVWLRGVAAACLAASMVAPVWGDEGLKPPPAGTISNISIEGKYGGSFKPGKDQEPQKFEMPLGGKLELVGFGDAKSPRYVLIIADPGDTPFFRNQGLAFLKARGSEIVEDAGFASFNMSTRLVLPLLTPRGLSGDELKSDTRDISASTLFNPLGTKIRCEVTLEQKPDGLHVIRKLAPSEKKAGDDRTEKPAGVASETKEARPAAGPNHVIRAWREEFVIAKDSGLLVSGRSSYEVDMSFGEQSQVLNLDLTLKVADRRQLSEAQTAAVADDAKRLQKLAQVQPVFSEEVDKLKQALGNFKRAEEDLDAFAKERPDSPLKSGVAAVRNQIREQAVQFEAQIKEAEFVASLVGKPAPDFTLKNLADEDVNLSSFVAGKVALISFWGFG